MKESHVYKGQAYKEWGKYEESYSSYSKAIAMDSNYAQCFYLRGVCSFSVGKHIIAIGDFAEALKHNSAMLECRHMLAVAQHGLVSHQR